MRKLLLHVSDEVLREIKSHCIVKGISGDLFGVCDAILMKIYQAITNGDTEVTLKFKNEDKQTDSVFATELGRKGSFTRNV